MKSLMEETIATHHNPPSLFDLSSIRRMEFADIPEVVQVHIKSFSGFFLTSLGGTFLRELYVATLADNSGFGFIAENEKGICGFVTGTAQPAGFYRRLLRQRWWRFALAAAAPLVKRPAIAPRLLRAFSAPEQATEKEGRGTLMSISVLPEAHGLGIGQALVREFLVEAGARDLNQVDLVTDRNNNKTVNCFYQKLGFICERTYTTPEGREMNEYVFDLADD